MTKQELQEQVAEWLFWYDTAYRGTNTDAVPLLFNKLETLGIKLESSKKLPKEPDNDIEQ